MVMQPKLLILDEPTSQLDPIAASDFLATLKKINTELGTTILISEHRLEELLPMADRVLVMEHGQLAIDDGPREAAALVASGVCREMFYGLPAVVKIASAVKPEGRFPLTVREGRLWLEECLGQPGHETPEKNKRPRLRPHTVKSAQSTSMPSVVSMHDVWFRYGKTSLDTLRGVELAVREGELFALSLIHI